MDARLAIIDQPPSGTQRPLPDAWRDGLTEKEQAFVAHLARYRNVTQAYTHAYDTQGTYETRARSGQDVARRPRIQAAVLECRRATTYEVGASVSWLLERFVEIGTADPRELIGLKVGACRYCWGEGHRYFWRLREYLEACAKADADNALLVEMGKRASIGYPDPAGGLDFNATHPPHPDCPQCHGEGVERFVPRDTDNLSDQALLLYGGVKVKADGGYEIIVADRQKALELAGRIMGAFNDKLNITAKVGHMHAIADLRTVDPQEAAKAYKEFVAGHLA